MKFKLLIVIAMLVMTGSIVYGNDKKSGVPLIKAVVQPKQATVGTLLDYRVNIAGKGLKNISIVPPEKREYYPEKKKDDAMPKKTGEGAEKDDDPAQFVPLFVIHSIKKNDRSDKSMTDITISIQLSYYRPGSYSLPEVEIKGADGIAIGYNVPAVDIKAINEKGQLEDIEPPMNLGGNYTRLIILILCVLVAAVGGFFLFRYLKKIYDDKKTAPIIIPPIDIFLKEINSFNGERLIDDGKIEEYVFGISMIFRKFLSLQFKFDAMEMTTYEIEKKIRRVFSRNLNDSYTYEIMQNFNMWDLSKFAEFTPSQETLRANLDKTVQLAKNLSGDMSNGAPRI